MAEISNCIEKQDTIQVEFDRLNCELEKSDIPAHYRHLKAVKWMVNAYNNGRGSTHAELINLYEQELNDGHRNNIINEQNTLLRTLQEQNRQQQIALENANQAISELKKQANQSKKG